MNEIKEQIKIARPNLRESTLNTYMAQLRKMSFELSGGALDDLAFFIDTEKVIDWIDTLSPNVGNTFMSTIIVALTSEAPRTAEIDELVAVYRDIFKERKQIYRDSLGSRKKTQKESDQWTSMKALLDVQKRLGLQVAAAHIADKPGLNQRNKWLLQRYLIASLYTLLPPRRLIYSSVKLISNKAFKSLTFNQRNANYLVFSKKLHILFFFFGCQKSKCYKEGQIIKPTAALKKVLKIYLQHNVGNDTLLLNRSGGPMSTGSLAGLIENMFGIRVGMIRKIYISHKTAKFHKTIEKIADGMGHSVETAKNFYLKD